MDNTYSIQEDTLTSIGDALRRKFGETKIITVQDYLPLKVISKTSNATGTNTWNGAYPNSARIYDVVNIPGAVKIEVNLYAQTEGTSWDWVQVASGVLDESNFPTDATKYGGQSILNYKLIFENTDTITFFFRTDGSTGGFLGYYAECMGYDVDGNVLMSDELADVEREVLNDYSPLEMPQAIDDIPDPIEIEPVVLTGDCSYACSGAIASAYVKNFGDTISTHDITSVNQMFSRSTLQRVPFTFNFPAIGTSNSCNANSMFWQAYSLLELPDMTGRVLSRQMVCASCYNIREIPDSWKTVEWLRLGNYDSCRHFFQYCYSLRSVPIEIMRNVLEATSTSSSYYYGIFDGCSSLDEIVGFRGSTGTLTSNIMTSMFESCYRLSRMVFDMEDGSPLVRNWKNQTLDLSYNAGWAYSKDRILNYKSGITADKEVKDDATYQTLKNDADWFSLDVNYSRYNHTSAVETINSLPDCSSSGGTNTIKFKGAAGSKTSGGAINTLTAEEIAVATAKGWTVSLV